MLFSDVEKVENEEEKLPKNGTKGNGKQWN